MEEIQKIFDYQGAEVRTVIDNDELWFVAKDVCDILELNPSEAVRGRKDRNFEDGLDDIEFRDDIDSTDTIGRKQKVLAVSEPGLYNLIFKSRKSEAKKFKRWITHEVIPSIRKTGSYSTERELGRYEKELMFAEVACRVLKLPDTGKILMLSKVCDNNGIDGKLLPNYADEQVTKSLSELLKQFNVTISAIKANQILIDKGILEPKTRPSKSGIKTFLSLTDNGLKFGKNLISPYNVRETQPHYYEKTFEKLIATMIEEVVLN